LERLAILPVEFSFSLLSPVLHQLEAVIDFSANSVCREAGCLAGVCGVSRLILVKLEVPGSLAQTSLTVEDIYNGGGERGLVDTVHVKNGDCQTGKRS
jgi:hypothetical protein